MDMDVNHCCILKSWQAGQSLPISNSAMLLSLRYLCMKLYAVYLHHHLFLPLLFSALLTPTVIPSSRSGVLGETFRLFCNASGNPKPEVLWRKDGQLLHFDGSR